ncbi:MAG: ABC transporter permease [Planctomycetes bacterium]|jgi:ABC-type lipoprotein release transport system permease subunit|nr:ABC transporter permease [Planctomycetota bacterium]
MSLGRLVARSLRFYWRTNLAVLLAVVVATGVLTGALAVGDSVRYTLGRTLEARLGKVQFASLPQGRFFRTALAGDLEKQLGGTVAPVLQVSGIVTNDDGSRRINRVQVLGVTDRFYAVGPGGRPLGKDPTEGIILSEAVARRLGVGVGDEIVLRVEKPGLMPREVPLASDKDRTVAARLKVQAIADDAAFGRFDLQANQIAALNVFVPLSWLGERIEQPGRANMLVVAHLKTSFSTREMAAALQKAWRLADAGLELEHLPKQNVLELRSRRVFIDEPLAAEALRAGGGSAGVLTYFVNEVRLGDKATPYSMVAALDGANLADDEIAVNQWLADDLGAKVGDAVDLAYFVIGPERKLREDQGRFKIARVVPLDDPVCDRTLMPAFPGLADVNNCRDWKPGIPVDLDKIRPEDEEYWNEHRGTPKAFISLAAGQARWRNQYGSLTAVRYPWREGLDRQIEQHLLSTIDPATVGLFLQPIRDRGLQASRGGTDFGSLFLGLSMFLIAAAVILTGLLFVFGVENRRSQAGMLMAVGWPARRVRRLLLAEGGLVALFGTVLGVGAGLLYTRLMVYGLATWWSGAIGGTDVHFDARGLTLLLGGLGGLLAALLAIWLTLRRQATCPARPLLAGDAAASLGDIVKAEGPGNGLPRRRLRPGRFGIGIAVAAFVGVAAVLLIAPARGGEALAGAFFGAGALLLIGTLALTGAVLQIVAGSWDRPMTSLQGLGLRSAGRRSGRSLAIAGLLACGVFMVVAVGANRRDPTKETHGRDSGTGGFALYGDASIPILSELGTAPGRDRLGLTEQGLESIRAVQFRVREGDDASCLNLNRAQQPRLMGVRAEALKERGAFKFTATVRQGREEGWGLLQTDLGAGVIPAVGDYPTVFWGLGKNIGDELEYTDEMGRPFRVRIVGMLASSVLQGSLVIAEDEFLARFPSVDGYRVFLIDVPAEKADAATQTLTADLRDYGLLLTPTGERLAAFGSVENTYLSIFMVLGGLGLVLGSMGLGLVVLRNMLERRGELAMLRAVGFGRGRLRRMVFYEHWGLLLAGLACGVISAMVAVMPALQSPGAQVPYLSLATMVGGIALSGAVWVWLAGTLALQGRLLDALRHE